MPRGMFARRKGNGYFAWRNALAGKFYEIESAHGTTEAVVRIWRAGMRAAYDARNRRSRAAARRVERTPHDA